MTAAPHQFGNPPRTCGVIEGRVILVWCLRCLRWIRKDDLETSCGGPPPRRDAKGNLLE